MNMNIMQVQVTIFCDLYAGTDITFEYLCHKGGVTEDSNWVLLIGGILWWLSLLWTTAHVWYPKSEVLAVTEKYVMFVWCKILRVRYVLWCTVQRVRYVCMV